MLIGAALRDATRTLREAGSPTPRLDAEVLLAHATGRDRAWLLAHPEAEEETDGAFRRLVERRATGEPIAYIRGFKEWRSLPIRTDRRALIPRPETELLLEAAVREIEDRIGRGDRHTVSWEVATGSGAVAVALALRFGDAVAADRLQLVATDLSPDALSLAAENLAAHGVDDLVRLAPGDLLEPAGTELPRPDVVVANLPYVPSAEVRAAGGSLAFEPAMALDGGPDGLGVVRRLLSSLPRHVAERATVLLEIGAGQADAVRALAPAGASVEVLPDLAGIGRVVRIGLSDSSSS